MYTFVSILAVITSILLVLIVIVQNSKGGGLAAGFASSNQVMGVRKTTDFLEKATWWLAGMLVALAILATIFLPRKKEIQDSILRDEIIESAPIQDMNTIAPFEDPIQESAPAGEQLPPITAPVAE
ncbi:MAG: preprotein translocase subunit SecG [Dysgonamonadaceae bacterium]|jgi:preprotein translocase subunit SecG|nr:preprotein translocase subunit SecG [Dysgonamonadaceae bacterium]